MEDIFWNKTIFFPLVSQADLCKLEVKDEEGTWFSSAILAVSRFIGHCLFCSHSLPKN